MPKRRQAAALQNDALSDVFVYMCIFARPISKKFSAKVKKINEIFLILNVILPSCALNGECPPAYILSAAVQGLVR